MTMQEDALKKEGEVVEPADVEATQDPDVVESEEPALEAPAEAVVAEQDTAEDVAASAIDESAVADAAEEPPALDDSDDEAEPESLAEPIEESTVVAQEVETSSEPQQPSDTDIVSEPEPSVDESSGEEETETVLVEAVAEATATEEAAEDKQDDDESPAAEDADDDDSTRVVRILAVGQQIDGVVKRIADFGAFVDIGVGRDGLLHISELSLQRVAKVSDVLSPKQPIQPWIKKLDRERNRISLTLIDPEQKTIRDLHTDEIVTGTVSRILPYGAFIDIGIGRDALLHVREMSNKYVEKPEDVVQVGETLEARIIEVSRRRGRVDLSLKGLRDEPEEESAEAEVTIDEEIEEIDDDLTDVEVLSTMELAFKKAVEAEGEEVRVETKQGRKRRKSDARAMQDEIIARTLDTSRK